MEIDFNQMYANQMPNPIFNDFSNQMAVNQNMNQTNPNQINMNQNINQINQNIMDENQNMINMNQNNININPNMNQMNQNMIFNMNPNFNQMYQMNNINNMNQNVNQINNMNQVDEVVDVLPYIKEPKIILKFSTILSIKKGTYITVKLPKSITKKDLYSIAKSYQYDYNSDIILSYNNYLLPKNNTTIEDFEEGSIINIIENIDIPDGSYYKYLMKKNENYERTFFHFNYTQEKTRQADIEFPINITVGEMMKATFSKLLLNSKTSRFVDLHTSLNTKISSYPKGTIFRIYAFIPNISHWMFGEIINVKIKENNKEPSIVTIGTLNSIRQLIKEISYKYDVIFPKKKLKKLYIGKHEFFVDEISDFSLKSIGINENCECEVEFGYA